MKKYLIITVVTSILVGIILPLVLGVKDLTLIAICYSLVWVIYAVFLLVTTFLSQPSLRIKVSRQKGATVVKYELSDTERGGGFLNQGLTIYALLGSEGFFLKSTVDHFG